MADPILSLNAVFFDESGELDLTDGDTNAMGEMPLIGVHMMLPLMTTAEDEGAVEVRSRLMIEPLEIRPGTNARRRSA